MTHENDDRRILILYGSQTGTAHDYAERLVQDARRRHFQYSLMSMNECDLSSFRAQNLVVFVCSTTGQGNQPDNMQLFWNFLLRRDWAIGCLSSLKIAVIGLGDSSYQKFNFVAKKLFRRLLQLGATALVPLGLADDQHDFGADGVFDPWVENLWNVLMKMYPLPASCSVLPSNVLLPSKYKVVWLDGTDYLYNFSAVNGSVRNLSLNSNQENVCAVLVGNKRVTAPEHFQDTRLISFELPNDSDIQYLPGDVAVLWPHNLQESVEDFINVLYLQKMLNHQFYLQSNDGQSTAPLQLSRPCTVIECIRSFFDLQKIPSRSFFKLLSLLADNELEKEKLEEFCMAENQDDLYSYCNRPRRTVVEVLQDFPHTAKSIPFDYLFELLRPIQPRSFSIASCKKIHSNEIQLLVAVVKYKTRMAKPRKGLCSTWLSNLTIGSEVALSIAKGMLSLPTQGEPCIFIGPGTGVAPFRNCIYWRWAQGFKENYLYFGCRNESKDFYFREEWEKLEKEGFLTVHAAFSRDQDSKQYVQHKLQEDAELIWKLIKSNGFIYIAGSAKQMPNDVMAALKDIVVTEGGLVNGEAENYVQELERQRRIQMETWS